MTNRVGTLHRVDRRRLLLASTALSAALLAVPQAHANPPTVPMSATPQGGTVVGGAATITQAPNTVIITQSSARTAINWQSFNVGANSTVVFKQPNAQAIALNRVISNNPSIIAGRIDANGQIVLMNQSGVVFTPGSQVNAESLVVSTAGISAKNFMQGHMVFDAPPKPGARIVNDGTITMKQAGLAAFVAPQVVNRGIITATLGHIILAGASTFTLDISGDGLVSIDVTRAVRKVDLGGRMVDALVTNQGVIVADGGTVTLTAQAIDGVIQQLLDVRGVVRADSVGQSKGGITIDGIGGNLQVAGNLLARGTQPGAVGGTIAVDASGAVQVASSARIDASGAAGGGVVAIGTDAARALAGPHDRVAPKAANVSIEAGATVAADATQTGSGGTITLLSAQRTTQGGALSTQGISHGGTIETSSDGIISLSGTEAVFASEGSAGTILLDPATLIVAAGHSGSPAGTTTGGGVTTIGTDSSITSYVDPGSLDTLSGTIILTASSLLSVAAPINLTSAGTVLTLASGGDIAVNAAVLVAGSLEIDASGAMTIGAPITAPGITLHDIGTGTIGIGGNVDASGQLALLAGGGITEASNAYISTGTLALSAATQALLGGAINTITHLGTVTSGGTFVLNDGGASLSIDGALNAAGAAVAADGLSIGAPVSMAATVVPGMGGYAPLSLSSSAGIEEVSGGSIVAGSLSGSGGGLATDNVLLGRTSNTISALAGFTTGGALILDDAGTPLAISGALSAATATLSGHGLVIASPVSVAGVLALSSDAGITATNANLSAGTLTSNGGTITGGEVLLSGAGNDVGTLGAFAAREGFSLDNAGNPLAIVGPFNATAATLNAGSIGISGTVATTGAFTISSTGTITELGTGVLDVASLTTGDAAVGGAVEFGGGNSIGTIGAFTAANALLVNDIPPLTITGPVQAAGIDLIDAGGLTLTGPLGVGAGGAINLVAGSLTDIGATVSAPNGTIALAPYSPGTPLDFGGTTDGGLAIAPSFVSALDGSGARALVLGQVVLPVATYGANTVLTEGPLASFAGSLTIGGADAITNTADLRASALSLVGGSIVNSGTLDTGIVALSGTGINSTGVVIAPKLGGSFSQGIVFDNPADTIGLISGLTAGTGGLLLLDGTAPTFGGTIAVATGASLTVEASQIVFSAGNFNAPAGTISFDPLLTGTPIALGGSSAGTLDLSSALLAAILPGVATLSIGNTLSGPLDVAASLSLAIPDIVLHGNGIALNAPISASNVLDLESAGSIIQTATISAATLTGAANGAVLLRAANQIGTIGGFTDTTGPFDLTDGGAMVVAGPLDAGTVSLAGLSLSIPGAITTGSLALTAGTTINGTGTLNATTLTGSAASLSLTGPNQIGTLGGLNIYGDAVFNDASSLIIAGPVSAAILALGNTSSITETGTITANTLTSLGTIGGAVALTGTNTIATLGSFTGAGAVSVNDGGPLTIAGPFTAGSATLTTGALSESGSIKANSFAAQVTGTLALIGTNTIANFASVSATGNATLFDQSATVFDGVLSAPNATIVAPGIGLNGPVATGVLSLTSTGSIVGIGTITASTLAGTAGPSVSLTGANTIATFGPFTGTDSITLNDTTNLAIAGSLVAPGLLALGDTGTVTQSAGISAGTLASFGTIRGDVRLTGNNTIATLGDLAATGLLNLADQSGFNIAGAVNVATATLATPGSITETGSLTTGQLAAQAAGLALTGSNTIAALGALSIANALDLADTVPLNLAGSLNAATLALGNTSSITETGTITANTLTSLGTIGGAVALTGTNTIATIGSFTGAGAVSVNDGGPLTIAGLLTASAATLATGALSVAGGISTGTLSLSSTGAVTATGSIIAATVLGHAGGTLALTGTNQIATIASLIAPVVPRSMTQPA